MKDFHAAGKALSLEPQSPISRLNTLIPVGHGPHGSASERGAGDDRARSHGPY